MGVRWSDTFVLRNSGDEQLRIDEVKPACGCTVAELASQTLGPGGSVKLKVTLSLKDRRGPQRKSVVVHSNDPKTPALTLWLRGKAFAPVLATPGQLFFGHVQPGTPVSRTVDITAEDGQPLAIDRLEIVPRSSPDDDAADDAAGDAADETGTASPWTTKLETLVTGSAYRVTVQLAGARLGARMPRCASTRTRRKRPRCGCRYLPWSRVNSVTCPSRFC